MTRRHLMLIFRLGCGVLLLWWALRRAELGNLADIPLWPLNTGWLLIAICLGGLSVFGWAVRWRIFLRVTGLRIELREAVRLIMFADFFNLYFLGPLGADGIRALFLNKRFPGRKTAIFHSILLDHASGLLGGAFLYAVFTRTQTAWMTRGGGLVTEGALVTIDIALGFLSLMTLSAIGAIMCKRLWDFTDRRIRMRATIHPLRPFVYLRGHGWELLRAQSVSVLSLICGYGAFWCAGHAVGEPVSALRIFGIMPMVDAIAAIPITISGLGVRENLFVELLGTTLPSGSQGALAVSLMGFAMIGVWGLVGGIWLALHRWRSGTQHAAEAETQASS